MTELLAQQIAQWDSRSKTEMLAIYNRFADQADFINQLCEWLQYSHLESGASWLLKHRLAENFNVYKKSAKSLANHSLSEPELLSQYRHCSVSQGNLTRIFKQLNQLQCWPAKLHILQSLDYLTIAANYVSDVELFLIGALAEDNKFVRSWAYNGFYLLACAYPQYCAQVEQLFEKAMCHESASVQARIRNIRKLG